MEETPPGNIKTLNGIDIYFEMRGTGEPLILLHGFSGSSQDWAGSDEPLGTGFRLIVPDLRGHGRSSILSQTFRHQDAADDIFALLGHAGVEECKAIGISGGGNVLLHMATKQPKRVKAMVLVSATPYFPAQARAIMRTYANALSEPQRDYLRLRHPGGDTQIDSILASGSAFADSYDDMNFTPPHLSAIRARTLIVQGDRDPFYPVEISMEMARAIPQSSLWIVPNGGHVPVMGGKWNEFLETAVAFLRE